MGNLIFAINMSQDGCCDHDKFIPDEDTMVYFTQKPLISCVLSSIVARKLERPPRRRESGDYAELGLLFLGINCFTSQSIDWPPRRRSRETTPSWGNWALQQSCLISLSLALL